MEIKRSGAQPSAKGPADWFTGTVQVDPLFSPRSLPAFPERSSPSSPARARPAHAPVRPDADDLGWVRSGAARRWPDEEVRPGDVVWFPAGEKHWHGATATTAMSYIAIQEKFDGKNVDWMEKVSDEQYGR